MRYGLRRQLVVNLGFVMFLASLLLSSFAMHMTQLRFSRDRTRYLRIVSEQIDQTVLLSLALEKANPKKKRRRFVWMPELGMNGALWPTDAALIYSTGEIRLLMGSKPKGLSTRMQKLQQEDMDKKNTQPKTSPSVTYGASLPMHSDVQWFRVRLTQRSVWERYRTLFRKGEQVGTLWLRWDLGVIRKEFYTYQGLLFLYLLLFCLLILFVVILFLEVRMVRPLNRLGEAMSGLPEGRVPSGELQKEVPRRDQIGDLAQAFLGMSEILRERSNDRQQHIQQLEAANEALERAQEELVQREKLATVGSLAAGVAHEVGNPLSAIMGYSDLLEGSKEWGELERDLVVRISRETKRIDRIIRDLLDYARPVSQNKPGDPVSSVTEALELLRLQQRFRDMEVETVWQTPLPFVRLSESYLIQVLINVLLNGADACGGKGLIKIRVFTMDTYVVIEITDNGPGIEPDVRERLFEPFVTTKAPGKGVGLGLALCRRLVTEAGGRIEVSDAPEGGAVFSIALPFASDTVLFDVEEEDDESKVRVVTTSSEDWATKWQASDSSSPEKEK